MAWTLENVSDPPPMGEGVRSRDLGVVAQGGGSQALKCKMDRVHQKKERKTVGVRNGCHR